MFVHLLCYLLLVDMSYSQESLAFKFPSKRQLYSQARYTGYMPGGSAGYYAPASSASFNPNRYREGDFAPALPFQKPQGNRYQTKDGTGGAIERPHLQPEQSLPQRWNFSDSFTTIHQNTTTTKSFLEVTNPHARCFLNEFGFKCCNVELMRFMLSELDHPTKSLYYRGCNLQKSCTNLQAEGQTRFNVTFEVSCAPSDFSNKGKFLGNWMCKYALMYASPHQYTLDAGRSRPLTLQEFENRKRNNGWGSNDLLETEFGMEDMDLLYDGVILGAGNPLLDVIVVVDKIFLDKWGLKENNSTPCTTELEGIFDEIELFGPKHVPGGTVQNTAMVFQWIISRPNCFTVLGTVGQDIAGEELTKKLIDNGVIVNYEVSNIAATGKCAVLINGHHRSMCTLLGASKLFSVDILDNPTIQKSVETAKFFYFSCQFFNASGEFLHRIAEHCNQKKKTFCLNLGSPLAQKRFSQEIEKLLPFVNVIFGNQEEILAFGESQGILGDIKQISSKITELNIESRIVIVTRASEPVLAAYNGDVEEFPIIQIPEEKIIDTNGAGDAFVGGFLSQFVQGKSLKICVECGNYAASEIIQQTGCSLPFHCCWP